MAKGNDNSSWFERVLNAFASLFQSKDAAKPQRSAIQHSRQSRHVAGHWPVHVEIGATTRSSLTVHDDSMVTLRFSASDAPLLKSMKIMSREFSGSYVPEKKAAIVQIPERLVQEIMRNQDSAVYVEGYLDGEPMGSRRFNIPLTF
ncbi:MAG: hypothetical protein JO142_13180 [Burkholderiales bacterium]|nr:hypothetical protein [Burkholderiales bacterium]